MNLRAIPLLVVALSLSPAAQVQKKAASPQVKPAETDTTIYRNATFGFRYPIPFGWVDRTKEMQEGSDSSKGEVLLAIFERPPQATGDTINSAVVIAAERATTYPDLKKAEDYPRPLTELTKSKGLKQDG